jgi:hypothetical protein
MSFNVGEHGAAMTGGFHSASPVSVTSICGDLLETFTCVFVRKAEKRAGHSGDGISVQRDLNPGLTSFMWTVLAPYNFVVSIVGFPSTESPMVCDGEAKERLDSSRVSMKNDKNSQENRGGGGWRAHGLGSSHQVMDVIPGDLVLGWCFLCLLLLPLLLLLLPLFFLLLLFFCTGSVSERQAIFLVGVVVLDISGRTR